MGKKHHVKGNKSKKEVKDNLKTDKSPSFLSVSLGPLTSKKEYNDQEAKKGAEKGFLNRFFDTVRIITSIKSNDVPTCKLLNDKMNIDELYGGVYQDNGCGFDLDPVTKIYSVSMSSKHHERLIGALDQANDTFYVIAIDFHHNAYNHGS